MDGCFLSIVIPVYNAAGYLGETLDSLLRQDISDYEILCVNDGSTDESPAILEAYASRYPNIRLIHQENAGVATARNVGLANARGTFLWFVDADDLAAPNILGKCKALAEETNCQRLFFGGFTFEDAMTDRQWQDRETLPCNVPWQDSVVWRNWLRVDFLKEHALSFRYPQITHGEDGLFMFEVARACPKTVSIPDIVYFYRIHSGSAETGVSLASRRKRLASHIRVVEVLKGYCQEDGGAYAANRLMAFLWQTLYLTAAMPKQDADAALARLKQLGLYPARLPRELTVRKTYLADDSTAVGKVLEFFCAHLHRPWGYRVVRTLHQVKHRIRK